MAQQLRSTSQPSLSGPLQDGSMAQEHLPPMVALSSVGREEAGAEGVNEPRYSKELLAADYECAICSDILLDPVVGACGHDFCKSCLEQWSKTCTEGHASLGLKRTAVVCPICRAEYTQSLGVCQRLKSMLESCFPEQVSQRRAEAQAKAKEVERRSQQLLSLQACFLTSSASANGSAAGSRAPSSTGILPAWPTPAPTGTTASRLVLPSMPSFDIPALPLAPPQQQQPQQQHHESSAGWDHTDHAAWLIADLADTSPSISAFSSQTFSAMQSAMDPLSTASLPVHGTPHMRHPWMLPQAMTSFPSREAMDASALLRSQPSLLVRGGVPGCMQAPTPFSSTAPITLLPSSRPPTGPRISGSGSHLPQMIRRTSSNATNEEQLHTMQHTQEAILACSTAVHLGQVRGGPHSTSFLPHPASLLRTPQGPATAPPLGDAGSSLLMDSGSHNGTMTLWQQHVLSSSAVVETTGDGARSTLLRRQTSNLAAVAESSLSGSLDQEQEQPCTPRAAGGNTAARFFGMLSPRGSMCSTPLNRTLMDSTVFAPETMSQQEFMWPPQAPPTATNAPTAAATPASMSKFSQAIKRMREEDEAALAAGRPRTSAMRRLFSADLSADRAAGQTNVYGRCHSDGGAQWNQHNSLPNLDDPAIQQLRLHSDVGSLNSADFMQHLGMACPSSGLRMGSRPAPAAPSANFASRTSLQEGRGWTVFTAVPSGLPTSNLDSLDEEALPHLLSIATRVSQQHTPVTTASATPKQAASGGQEEPGAGSDPVGDDTYGCMMYIDASGHQHDGHVRQQQQCSAMEDDTAQAMMRGMVTDDACATPRYRSTGQLSDVASAAATPQRNPHPMDEEQGNTARLFPMDPPPPVPSRRMSHSGCTPVMMQTVQTSSATSGFSVPPLISRLDPSIIGSAPRSAPPGPNAIHQSHPSILQLASPLRIVRRTMSLLDVGPRPTPATPRAMQPVPPSPFTPVNQITARARAQSLDAAGLQAVLAAVATAPDAAPDASRHPEAARVASLQSIVARRGAGPSAVRPAQPWHDWERDRPVRSACSSALVAMFTDRYHEQMGSTHPQQRGAVFLYVKAIEEYLYYNTTCLQEYADLSTLQTRMVQAVDALIEAETGHQ